MAQVSTTTGAFQELSLQFTADREGYVLVYTANQTAEDLDVFIDDLLVEHIESPVIRTDDYYPFGLAFNSAQRTGVLTNKYLFQGQALQSDLDLGWYSFKWRNHMPEIGRFFNVDPLASDYVYNSPYAFSENKVTSHVELEGLEAVSVQYEYRIMGGTEYVSITHSTSVGIIADYTGDFAVFVTPSLGGGSGLGAVAGWTGSYYHAKVGDIKGWGINGGVFWAPPTGGPAWSVEVNRSLSKKWGLTLNPNIGTTYGGGGGWYVEGSYTFFILKDNLGREVSEETLKKFEEYFGWSSDQTIGNIKTLIEAARKGPEPPKKEQEIPKNVKETLPPTFKKTIEDLLNDLFFKMSQSREDRERFKENQNRP